MSNTQDDEVIVLWEAPKIVPPEFRLYYDEDTGKVIFYTCEKPEGQYIVIDTFTYAECRFDIKVIDGKIVKPQDSIIIEKMEMSDEGYNTAFEDVNILVNDYSGKTLKWKLKRYEFERS